MGKYDNPYMVLMTNCKVNLQCDEEKLQCRYLVSEDGKRHTWYVNGNDTGLQVTSFYKSLKEKYKRIKVLYKKQF